MHFIEFDSYPFTGNTNIIEHKIEHKLLINKLLRFMTAGRKKRLFKIASEINIGKDAIVDFLASKGHEIDNKATTTLTPDLIELIYDKFKREKRAAEVQREKLVKHKIIRTKRQIGRTI